MGLEAELTAIVYNGAEKRLGTLNPDFVEITEIYTKGAAREIDIVHPLVDDYGNDLSKYDELLTDGNKIYRPQTCDGVPCLYVLIGPKKPVLKDNAISTTAIEVCNELSEYPIHHFISTEWIVDEDFINDYFSHLYDPGVLTGPTTAMKYSGCKFPWGMLQKIMETIDGEFQFRYEYSNGVIKRYIDFLDMMGKTHRKAIELGENASSINHSVSDVDVRDGAGPIGEPSSADDDFHSVRTEFENMAITKGQNIPFGVTKDSNGAEIVTGYANAPYAKNAGEGWVVCDEESERVASYKEINGKEKSTTKYPRLWGFDSSETNKYNLYWECVDSIREHTTPQITIECSVSDLKKIQGYDGEYYNTGDVVPVQIPGRKDHVQCRITETTKDPRKPDQDSVTIETYRTSFLRRFFKSTYKSQNSIDIQ